ncbi:MAG TPA: ZIP family metal transporter [Gemmatimonadaceae bacterium]|nr:ZIP family metal transporter [Gemmatimonadaceae bacterium]
MSEVVQGAAGARGTGEALGALDSRDPATPRHRLFLALGPLVLLALLVFALLKLGPLGVFRDTFPPIEELTIERVTLPKPGELVVHVVNGGPEAVTVAQVLVDDASWLHYIDGDRTLGRLDRRTIRIPYPWVEGEPHVVRLITSTGLTFDTTIDVATTTPSADARYLTTFALLGVYVGVIPVFLGLLWFPALRTASRRWLDFFLALTVGLLIFLGVDAFAEALETATRVPGAFQGLGLVLLGVLGTPLALAAIGHRGRAKREASSPFHVALLIAIGIGLHNLGEGLAIGAAYSTGAIALGTFLIIGFLLHNTTEGLGILAPIAKEQPSIGRLAMLGAIAGVPTVLGAWIGAFTYSPLWTTLFFAIGAGAIVQVVWELIKLFARRSEGGLTAPMNVAGLMAGLLIMYLTGLLVPA